MRFLIFVTLVAMSCTHPPHKTCGLICTDVGNALVDTGESRKAELFFESACSKGDATGCVAAHHLNKSRGDLKRSVEYLRRGCEYDDPIACEGLGHALFAGEGVDKDMVAAHTIFRKVCPTRVTACALLGVMYQHGLGVTEDRSLARRYFKESCDGGFKESCEWYAEMNPPKSSPRLNWKRWKFPRHDTISMPVSSENKCTDVGCTITYTSDHTVIVAGYRRVSTTNLVQHTSADLVALDIQEEECVIPDEPSYDTAYIAVCRSGELTTVLSYWNRDDIEIGHVAVITRASPKTALSILRKVVRPLTTKTYIHRT